MLPFMQMGNYKKIIKSETYMRVKPDTGPISHIRTVKFYPTYLVVNTTTILSLHKVVFGYFSKSLCYSQIKKLTDNELDPSQPTEILFS